MAKACIIFPHQLVLQNNPLLTIDAPIYLVEEYLFFKQYPFHKQKIAFHRATMKAFEQELLQQGKTVHYIHSTDELSDIRLLLPTLEVDEIHYINPVDNWLTKHIKEGNQTLQATLCEYDSPLFINTDNDLEKFFKPTKKKFHQTTFYKQERKRLNILLEADGKPSGGKWTFDTENRKKYPAKKTPPSIHFPENTEFWAEAVQYTNTHFEHHYGQVNQQPIYPITHQQAEDWLQQFFEFRFHEFGIYEDAIVQHEIFLNHSLIAPLINVGLLSPKHVVNQTILFARKNDIPINSLEGFIRQIIGWREFIRGIYIAKGTEERTRNFWQFKRKIPKSFYDGTTGIPPIDSTIKKVLETGYCHHIERLMLLANFMTLCEFDPDETYQWFMELFIDAYDWVMVPNVYGMATYSDGGLMSTKPYISSSNYVLKMSNYKKGDWQTTWDALFWRFMHKQRDFFASNPRLGMLLRNLDKMDEQRLNGMLENAEQFLSQLDGK